MRKLVRGGAVAAAAAAIAFLAPVRVAVACTCDTQLPPGNPVELAGRHDPAFDVGFIATVREVRDPVTVGEMPPGSRWEPGEFIPVVVDVEVALAGSAGPRAVLLQPSLAEPNERAEDCSFGFVSGGRYLVEARPHSDGIFLTDACTFTQPYGVPTATGAADPVADGTAATEERAGSWMGTWLAAGLLAVAAIAVLVMTFRQRPRVSTPAGPAEPEPPQPPSDQWAPDDPWDGENRWDPEDPATR